MGVRSSLPAGSAITTRSTPQYLLPDEKCEEIALEALMDLEKVHRFKFYNFLLQATRKNLPPGL